MLHPMQAKKNLARTITADFHSKEAAQHAEENWAKQFQQKAAPENLETVYLKFQDYETPLNSDDRASLRGGLTSEYEARVRVLRLNKILSASGLAQSTTEADRKISEKSVTVDSMTVTRPRFLVEPDMYRLAKDGSRELRLPIRIGKRIKLIVLQ